jgi:DNA-binding MarR family transcriptional regulator
VDPAGEAEGAGRVAGPAGIAFLLAQLGLYGAAQFGARLEPLGLEQRHAGMLFRLAANQGQSQQAVAQLIGVNATRMVFLVDELEKRGLIERRRNPADRRSHALYLTAQGAQTLDRVRAVSADHEAQLTAGLTDAERAQLAALLRRVAAAQGLNPRGMPGGQQKMC